MVKGSRPLIGTHLNCRKHPFFEDILCQRAECLLDRVFAKEGDFFEGFVFGWALVKELILKDFLLGCEKAGNLRHFGCP